MRQRQLSLLFSMTAAALCILLSSVSVSFAQSAPKLLRDTEVEQILREFGAPIFAQAGVSPWAVRFILVDDPDLNAFVAGGQNIFMNTGLLLKADNAQEVAGVIAHETGHIALGHLFRIRENVETLSAQTILATLLGVAVAIGSGSGEAGAAATSAGSHVAMRNLLRHTRTHEASADHAGVRYLRGASLPVTGLKTFMQKLESQELLPTSQQSEYVRTHPLTRDRIDFLKHASRKDGAAVVPENWPPLFARMQAKLLGYVYPHRALAQRGNDINTLYAKAIAHDRLGHADKAIALMDKLIQEEPDNPYFLEQQAQVLFQNGKITDSLPLYARAVEAAPSAGLIRAAYGHALLENARTLPEKKNEAELKKAADQLNQSLQTEPRQPQTHHFMAIAHGKLGAEGKSRLHLAEKYMLLRRQDLARKEAQLALQALPAQTPAWQRAQDILGLLDGNLEKK